MALVLPGSVLPEQALLDMTVEDVAAWIQSVIPAHAAEAIDYVREEEVDGEVLASFTETELSDVLRLTKRGPLRKLYLRIQQLKEPKQEPEPPTEQQTAVAVSNPTVHSPQTVNQPQRFYATPQTLARGFPDVSAGAMVAVKGSDTPCVKEVRGMLLGAMEQHEEVSDEQEMHFLTLGAAEKEQGETSEQEQDEHVFVPPASTTAGPHLPVTDSGFVDNVSDKQGDERQVDKDMEVADEEHAVVDDAEMGGDAGSEEQRLPVEGEGVVDQEVRADAPQGMDLGEEEVTAEKIIQQLRHDASALPDEINSIGSAVATELPAGKDAGVVVGDTGAGKSTLLNAALNETNLLPTNGMRACTATIMEIRHHATAVEGQRYHAAVEFVSREEFFEEVELMLSDMAMQDGRISKRCPVDRDSAAGVAFMKMRAVFGRFEDLGNERAYWESRDVAMRHLQMVRNGVTMALGTTIHVYHDEANVFRKRVEKYVDSPNDSEAIAFWPVVKKVGIEGPFEILKGAAVLVDAPGVRDDNSARDKVVKDYFKQADSIWIVSNVRRAVNDKTAKDMLGESFRRQLLMDGHYARLVFIASQTDVLVRSEIVDNLDLPYTATKEQCALAQNEYTKKRILDDFYEGINEMGLSAGEARKTRAELEASFSLPVFTVSAVDYQKLWGLRTLDGPPLVFQDSNDTEIPQLQGCVVSTAQQRQTAHVLQCLVDQLQRLRSIHVMLASPASAPCNTALAEELLEKEIAKFEANIRRCHQGVEGTVATAIQDGIVNRMAQGEADACDEGPRTVSGWGAKYSNRTYGGGGGTGMHWATYRASARRHGVFRHYEWNQQLAEPVYRSLAIKWQRFFSADLPKQLRSLREHYASHLQAMLTSLATAYAAIGIPEDNVRNIGGVAKQHVLHLVQSKVEGLCQQLQQHQKDINRIITEKVKEGMEPGYDAAYHESGSGSHERRKALMANYMDRHKGHMFADATNGLQKELLSLQSMVPTELGRLLASVLDHLRGTLRTLVKSKGPGIPAATRTDMAPIISALAQTLVPAYRTLAAALGVHQQWRYLQTKTPKTSAPLSNPSTCLGWQPPQREDEPPSTPPAPGLSLPRELRAAATGMQASATNTNEIEQSESEEEEVLEEEEEEEEEDRYGYDRRSRYDRYWGRRSNSEESEQEENEESESEDNNSVPLPFTRHSVPLPFTRHSVPLPFTATEPVGLPPTTTPSQAQPSIANPSSASSGTSWQMDSQQSRDNRENGLIGSVPAQSTNGNASSQCPAPMQVKEEPKASVPAPINKPAPLAVSALQNAPPPQRAYKSIKEDPQDVLRRLLQQAKDAASRIKRKGNVVGGSRQAKKQRTEPNVVWECDLTEDEPQWKQ